MSDGAAAYKTSKKAVGKWLTAIFGIPAAISFLADINDKLDFGPVVSEIVLNFNTFSYNVWNGLGQVIGLPLGSIHGTISFCLTFLGVVVASLLWTPVESTIRIGWPTVFELLSLSFLFVFMAMPDDSLEVGFSIFLTIVMFVLLLLHQMTEPRQTRRWYVALLDLVIFGAVLLAFSFFFQMDRHAVSGALGAVLCLSALRVIGTRRMAFTKVAGFALGVFLLDKLATKGIPLILDLTKDKSV